MADEMLRYVQHAFYVVLRRRREPGRYDCAYNRSRYFFAFTVFIYSFYGAVGLQFIHRKKAADENRIPPALIIGYLLYRF